MTDFDELFGRLRGLAWPHASLALTCFICAASLYISPVWGQADLIGLQRIMSWFAIGAGALSTAAAFASRAPWSLYALEPIMGSVMLLGGIWTLNFPFAAGSTAPFLSFVGIFLAGCILVTAVEMEHRGVRAWGVQVLIAALAVVVALANLLGVCGMSGVPMLASAQMYLASWGFAHAALRLSVIDRRGELA